VQAVDTAFAGSAWATQATFTVTNTPPDVGLIADQHTLPGVPVSAHGSSQRWPKRARPNCGGCHLHQRPAVCRPPGSRFPAPLAQRALVLTPSLLYAGETWVRATATDPQGSFTAREFRLIVDQFTEQDLGFEMPATYVLNASVVDLDDDGDLDLFLNGGLTRSGVSYPRMIGRNAGNGAFVWEPWNATNDPLSQVDWANSAQAWLDWDMDGRLDLVVNAGAPCACSATWGPDLRPCPRDAGWPGSVGFLE